MLDRLTEIVPHKKGADLNATLAPIISEFLTFTVFAFPKNIEASSLEDSHDTFMRDCGSFVIR